MTFVYLLHPVLDCLRLHSIISVVHECRPVLDCRDHDGLLSSFSTKCKDVMVIWTAYICFSLALLEIVELGATDGAVLFTFETTGIFI